MNEIEKRVSICFTNVFPALQPDEIVRASTASLAAWDSVAQVTLLSSVAEEFGLELEMEDYDELVSYALIVNYLESKAANG